MRPHRHTSDKDRRALKLATQRTVSLCGGQESSAMITRVSPKTLSDYANTGNERHCDTFMPVDVMTDLIVDRRLAGEVAPLLEALCSVAGGTFVRMPNAKSLSASDLDLVQVGKKLFCLAGLISSALANDCVSSLADHDREISEIINSLVSLKITFESDEGGCA